MYGSGDDIVGGRTNPDGMMDSSEEDGGSLADFVGDAPSEGDQGEGASDDEFEVSNLVLKQKNKPLGFIKFYL